jgi:alcohol dehydrogenase
MNARFYNPTRIVYGPDSLSRMGDIIAAEFRVERVLLVTDTGIQRAGIVDRVLQLLPHARIFDAVESNPRHTTVDRAGELARELGTQLVVGVGGGSVLDAAKAVALLAANPGCIEEYEGRGKYRVPPLPVVAVPTTCGTGSEVTWVAVITHTERRFKMSIKGPAMFPAVALVDPDLLVSLPPELVAATGMDALVHAVEAFSVKPATFITDIFAAEAVELAFRYLTRAYRDIRNDHQAREGAMRASLLAGLAFGNSDVGAVHCLSESVGALFDTPHGVANAVFLPYVMDFNRPAASARYAELARRIGLIGEGLDRLAVGLIEKVKDLSRALAIPRFKDLDISPDCFPEIAEKSFSNNSNSSNAREATREDYQQILENAYRTD